MSREFKNKLKLVEGSRFAKEVKKVNEQVFEDSLSLPHTLLLKDIDIAFKDWVEKDLDISFENKKLETIALFSNQRFSEYMQSWENVDDNENIMLNFKVITRENNPNPGTIQGDNKNIVSNSFYTVKRFLMQDANKREYFKDIKMKQPYAVDLNYTVNIVTNKYTLLNDFNMMVNEKFKAIQCYICPNGYFIPMKLESISDESEYNINDRQFFSQSFAIKVEAYIIREQDIIVEEIPMVKLSCFNMDGDKTKNSVVEIEEPEDDQYYSQGITLTIDFAPCEETVEFKMITDFKVTGITQDNLISYKIKVNGILQEVLDNLYFKNGDIIRVSNAKKKILRDLVTYEPKNAKLVFKGNNPKNIFDKRLDNPESELDRTQKDLDVKIE